MSLYIDRRINERILIATPDGAGMWLRLIAVYDADTAVPTVRLAFDGDRDTFRVTREELLRFREEQEP
jgi:hypothetical protein